MFSGAMQGALYTTLNGVHGRAGWRWLFLVNGVLTIFVALAGYFCFPGFVSQHDFLRAELTRVRLA